ncbi:murein hydrolase activator EnvC family protein [Paenibacillus barengoltzii]|uniref:Murein hydrolase activator EnvC family protein n=1 Tax=Paenibacillus timonensis TaxID=225915 RepID=A0ABW3S828_9BACL|nr:peptidoglycan DD-metalloendopeptidase family protein [Paenibacillus timonensis]MCH1638861.1 peptidoglycan DD-metalloendopeptidase family protein [Paenibacillus timonensis]
MKKWIVRATLAALAAFLTQPALIGNANSISQLDKELQQLQERARQAEQKRESAEQQKQEAQHYVNKNQQYLQQVMNEMKAVSTELTRITADIDKTEEALRQTSENLNETMARIEERQDWLDSRVRLMYTDGTVSYLDVLLSSTSFADFLERASMLQALVNQDRVLLAEHKKNKASIEKQQKQLGADYAKIKVLYADAESRKSILERKEKEKQELIAKYNSDLDESEVISEEQDALLVELATKRAALQKEKNKLAAQQVYSYKRSSNGSFQSSGGAMAFPVSGARISSNYGTRVHPITGKIKKHNGVDMAAKEGTEIRAADDGVVIVAEWWSGYGNTVVIDHGDNLWTLYPHIRNNGIKVEKGQAVKRGQKIAEVGSTGNSTGPHLHFEVRIDGKPVDPMRYL